MRRTPIWLLILGAAPLAAQSRQVLSVQASGLVMTLSGRSGNQDQFAWKTGFGGEGQFRINPRGLFSVGAGVQFTSHSGSVAAFSGDRNKVLGFFIEPRYLIPVNSRGFRPYIAGRLALLRQKLDLQGLGGQGGFSYTANAVAFGGGGGFVVKISNNINFDLGLAIMTASFKNYKDSSGNDSGEAAGSTTPFLLKAGINLGFGK